MRWLDRESGFGDRLALGFLNALVGLLTGLLLWLVVDGLGDERPLLPAAFILWFTTAMAVAGMLVKAEVLAEFYGRLWHFVARCWAFIFG